MVLWVGILAGCASTPQSDVKETRAESMGYVGSADYLIGVDDQLQILVWRNPDLGVSAPVRPDGNISVPLIGDVQAGGRRPSDLANVIKGRLAEYIRDPNVTVIVTQLRSHEYLTRVRITGAVTNPLSIPHRPGMTVLDLVLEAGGVTEFAAPARTRVYRRKAGKTEVLPVDLDKILTQGALDTNILLKPGDVVTVPERFF